MKSFLNNLLKSFQPTKARAAKRIALGIECLEARENLSTTTALIGGTVYVWGDQVGCNVTISRPNLQSDLKIIDNQTQTTWKFPQSILDHTPAVVYGNFQSDKVSAAGAWNPVTLYGNGGADNLTGGLFNDKIYGGAGNDRIHGGGGDDFLLGGADNDAIFGGAGIDYCDGEAGNDFLDNGGSAADVSKGGGATDIDLFANKIVVNGTKPEDIDQQNTGTCWLLAPLAAAAKNGINLASRITYLGEGIYQVKLLHTGGGFELQKVSLADNLDDLVDEPAIKAGESWVILYQRAILQSLGTGPDSGGWASSCATFLTGRSATDHGGNAWELPEKKSLGGKFTTWGNAEMELIKSELAAGHLVVATTRVGDFGAGDYSGDVSTAKLIGNHVYAVVSVNANGTITMRNPWGHDVPQGGIASGDEKDALVTITFAEFYASMWSYTTS